MCEFASFLGHSPVFLLPWQCGICLYPRTQDGGGICGSSGLTRRSVTSESETLGSAMIPCGHWLGALEDQDKLSGSQRAILWILVVQMELKR